MSMKALLFDPYSGASGDMIMGCLLDLGADREAVEDAVRSVGCSLEVSEVQKSHIRATRARVISDRRYRSLGEAVSILQGSSLHPRALDMALQAMDALAIAEGKVHSLPKDQARFHEIGALDALADIAGSCAAFISLDTVAFSLPISVGGGTVPSSHGLLPVPGPAAMEILRSHDMPWRGGPVDQELLTPTGAAIMSVLVQKFLDHYPLIRAESVGYGAGSRDLEIPNLLRAVIGNALHEHIMADRIMQLETNVDDVTGEVLGNLIELLMAAGALDVSIAPAVMKKGRPGSIIRAIVRQDDIEDLARLIMIETGSLGVRVFPSLHRYVAKRESRELSLNIDGRKYHFNVKISRLGSEILNVKPEYEDCRKIASEAKMPLRSVILKAEEEGWKSSRS